MTKAHSKIFTNADDAWIGEHFEELIDKYPGQYLVVVEGKPFIGRNAAKLFKKVRSKYPGITPTCMPIPRPKDFVSILQICRLK